MGLDCLRGQNTFPLFHSADLLWGQPRLLSGGYLGLFTEVKEAGASGLPPSSTVVNNT